MEQITNFARTTLDGAILNTDMTLTLIDAGAFPQKFFHIIVEPNGGNREIIFVESRTGNVLTVAERGAKGTTAIGHASGVQVIHTALAHNFPTHTDRGTLNNPNISTLRAGSDEFDDGVLDSDWVEVKRGTNTSITTWSENNDVLSLYHEGLDNNSEMIGLVRPMNGLTAPVTIEVAQKCMNQYANNYLMWGTVFTDNPNYGSGSQIFSMPYIDSTTAGLRRSFRSGTGWVSTTDHGTDTIQLNSPLYTRLRWNVGNTWECFWSPDGVSWIRYPNSVIANNFTPTHFGVWASHWGINKTTISTWEYFRVY